MALIVRKEAPFLAKHDAFPYQAEAVEAVRDLPYAGIFHEQGLGKTKIAVDVILYWLQNDIVDTVILITKKSLIANWQRELAQHSYLKPRILTADRTQNFYVFNSPVRVILANFEAIGFEKTRIALFQKTRRVAAVLDESAKIKNPGTALTKSFFALSSGFSRRMIMSGTPVANRPQDLWAQIFFLDRGQSLGDSFNEFEAVLDLANDLGKREEKRTAFENSLSEVWEKISHFCVRETKDGGRVELPAKIIENIQTSWEPNQRRMYLSIRDEARVSVIEEGVQIVDESPDLLKRLLRLVQVASNPLLIDESYAKVPGKVERLDLLVADIVALGEKVIVWTSFTENADWLRHHFEGNGAVALHGKMPIDQRNRNVEKFLKQQDCRVLVATPGAAKEGLTLTVANHVIFYDRGFSLDDYLQAQDRIHRVSQVKTCYVYNLVMEDSVDSWIDALLDAKRSAAQLAQGDITKEVFQMRMSYSFGEILQKILGFKDLKEGMRVE